MDALKRYRWRGNIRELRNTVERLIIMSEGDVIDVVDLPGFARPTEARRDLPARGCRRRRRPAQTPARCAQFKESAERAYLVEKLRENGWNISKTAEVIGTPRSNLYKKLEQYAIRQETDG